MGKGKSIFAWKDWETGRYLCQEACIVRFRIANCEVIVRQNE